MTGSSSNLLQIQGKWYQERKPKKSKSEAKKIQKLCYTIGSQILHCFVGIESQKSGENGMRIWNRQLTELEMKSRQVSVRTLPEVTQLYLLIAVWSWFAWFAHDAAFLVTKAKRVVFFTPRVSHSDQHDQHKNKNMPFLALNTIQILMSIPSGSARGQSPPRGTTAASCGHDQLFGPRAKSGWDRPKSCTGSETLLLTCKNHPMPSGINVPSGWIGGWFSWCFMRIKAP